MTDDRGAHAPGRPLPVMLPPRRAAPAEPAGFAPVRLSAWHGFTLGAAILVSAEASAAVSAPPGRPGVLAVLLQWSPLLWRGFAFNILISTLAMTIGTVLGFGLGLLLMSRSAPARGASWAVTQFFRNAPWLVLLFFMTFLLPFRLRLGYWDVPLPGWFKAVIGLSLPVMANMAEIVRGGVLSIDRGQWESAISLGLRRHQQLFLVVLPQAVKRMLPPWMNLYAILTMSTTLASIVGVNEVLTLAGQVLAAAGGRTDLMAPLYGYILLMFFLYCYPIARLTLLLERRYAVRR